MCIFTCVVQSLIPLEPEALRDTSVNWVACELRFPTALRGAKTQFSQFRHTITSLHLFVTLSSDSHQVILLSNGTMSRFKHL